MQARLPGAHGHVDGPGTYSLGDAHASWIGEYEGDGAGYKATSAGDMNGDGLGHHGQRLAVEYAQRSRQSVGVAQPVNAVACRDSSIPEG